MIRFYSERYILTESRTSKVNGEELLLTDVILTFSSRELTAGITNNMFTSILENLSQNRRNSKIRSIGL